MNTNELLELISQPVDAELTTDVAQFIQQLQGPLAEAPAEPVARLIACAMSAGSQSTAGIAGHQAAVRRLFPDTPSDAVTAFCISEERGPHPRFINTALDPDTNTISGKKMWGSMAPAATTLYVAASRGMDANNQNQLVMVAVDNPHATIEQIPLPPERQVGDMPICDLQFNASPAVHTYPEDAYETYIKPFRLIEDVFNTLATQIVLFRLGVRTGLDRSQREDLLGLITQGHAVATSDMTTPTEIMLLTSYLRASQAQWAVLASRWHTGDPTLYKFWQPGRMILTVAARAREQRRENAWQAFE